MATNSDLKRWYKVYGIQPGDFVRYTDMFRILCYDATEDFHAVNLGQVKRMLQNFGTTLNLENGEGTGSIQQKTWKYQDYTILGALANGFGSVAFGGARADIDAENLDRSSADGIQSFVAGVGVHAYGLFSSAFNKDTKSYQGGSVAFGGGTKAGQTETQFNEENSFTVDGVRCTRALSHYNCLAIEESDSSVYIVNDINERPLKYQKKQDGVVVATLSYSLAEAQEFDIVEQYQGRPYIISWSFAIATGDTTEATGRNSFAANQNTKATGQSSSAFGEESVASHTRSAVFGEHNRSSRKNQFVIGEFNEDDSEALFIVGKGLQTNTRSNAFVVRAEGVDKTAAAYVGGKKVATIDDISNIGSSQLYEHNITLTIRKENYTTIGSVTYQVISSKSTTFTIQDLINSFSFVSSSMQYTGYSKAYQFGSLLYSLRVDSSLTGPGGNAFLNINVYGADYSNTLTNSSLHLIVDPNYFEYADDSSTFKTHSISDTVRQIQ